MEATGGVIEAAYHGVIPDRPAYLVVEHLISRLDTVSSFQNWWVAEQAGAVVGGVNAGGLSASAHEPPNALLLEERRYLFQPFRPLLTHLRPEESYYIRAIAVYPDHRSAGVGSLLMAHVHREGKAKGFSETSLVVFAENTRAVDLYKRLGYTQIARGPAPTHELIRYGGDVLVMARRA
jgi:ribosomal protein S18 acetylase RimI-like enzyme